MEIVSLPDDPVASVRGAASPSRARPASDPVARQSMLHSCEDVDSVIRAAIDGALPVSSKSAAAPALASTLRFAACANCGVGSRFAVVRVLSPANPSEDSYVNAAGPD
jgi:hypothetical protein